MFIITKIHAIEILDSRGIPTIETTIVLQDGSKGIASVPSGASTGTFEAVEKRDNNTKRYLGKGVQQAIAAIHGTIAKAIIGTEFFTQQALDQFLVNLDGTENKSHFGANAILSISLAFARACANSLKLPLFQYIGGICGTSMPRPLFNIINGGVHADNGLDIQEFMITPLRAKNFAHGLQIAAEIFHHLKKILKQAGHSTNVGDEGGFAPNLSTSKEALSLIICAVNQAGYLLGEDVGIALDVAANEIYKDGMYHLDGQQFTAIELTDYYQQLINNYYVISIEDGLAEEDWQGWQHLTAKLGETVQLVGDDLFVTNSKRLENGINNQAANAILIKLNQIGTLSETLQTIHLAQKNGFAVIISHRSGETEDAIIADLAVATNAGQIKAGSLSRSDRLAKYNQLLRIEAMLNVYKDLNLMPV